MNHHLTALSGLGLGYDMGLGLGRMGSRSYLAQSQALATGNSSTRSVLTPTIRVDARRAADAYRKAIVAIDSFAMQHADLIAQIDEAAQADFTARHEAYMAGRERRAELRTQIKAIDERLDTLAAAKHSFWGWSKKQKAEFKTLTDLREGLCAERDSLPSHPKKKFTATPRIEDARSAMLDNMAVAEFSIDPLQLTKSAISELHLMETDAEAWLLDQDDFRAVIDKDFRDEMNMLADIDGASDCAANYIWSIPD